MATAPRSSRGQRVALACASALLTFLVLGRVAASLCPMSYVPDDEEIRSAWSPFLFGATHVRGVYGDRDVPSEVFSFRAPVRDRADLAQRMEEAACLSGWSRVADVDGLLCFQKAHAGGPGELRMRLDPATGDVVVGYLSRPAPGFADEVIWSRLR